MDNGFTQILIACLATIQAIVLGYFAYVTVVNRRAGEVRPQSREPEKRDEGEGL